MHAASEDQHPEQDQTADDCDCKECANDALDEVSGLISGGLSLLDTFGSGPRHGFRWRFDGTVFELIHCKVDDAFRRQPMGERDAVCAVDGSRQKDCRQKLRVRAQIAKNSGWFKKDAGQRSDRRHSWRRIVDRRHPDKAENDQQHAERAHCRTRSDPADDHRNAGNAEHDYHNANDHQGNACPHQVSRALPFGLSLNRRRWWRVKLLIWIAHARLSSCFSKRSSANA